MNGNYNMAIKLYYDLEKVLADELGVEPSPEIKELFHRIFNVKGNIAVDNGSWNLPFTGRTEEIYRISECLTGSGKWPHPQCVAIGGEEGVGKSALLEKTRQMVKGIRWCLCMRPAIKTKANFSSVPGMIFSGKSSSAWKAGFWNGTLRMMKEEN